MKYECDRCKKKLTKGKDVFALEDDMVCEKCFNDAIELAEYMYESQMEDRATGN